MLLVLINIVHLGSLESRTLAISPSTESEPDSELDSDMLDSDRDSVLFSRSSVWLLPRETNIWNPLFPLVLASMHMMIFECCSHGSKLSTSSYPYQKIRGCGP